MKGVNVAPVGERRSNDATVLLLDGCTDVGYAATAAVLSSTRRGHRSHPTKHLHQPHRREGENGIPLLIHAFRDQAAGPRVLEAKDLLGMETTAGNTAARLKGGARGTERRRRGKGRNNVDKSKTDDVNRRAGR